MKSEKGKVFRGSNRTGGNKDGGRKSKRGFGIANTKIGEGRTKILRTGELLSSVYRRICNGSKAAT